ncbi:MAG: ribonuclease HII [Rhodobacteraceae bacterium]|nr:ribonuclease HII [Paracoccaceae bacterium]
MGSCPDDAFEAALRREGFRTVAGVDEAGRGPLAGPVVAAAVILSADPIPGINDSKRLTADKRQVLAGHIRSVARTSLGVATVDEIAEMNILWATMLAMRRAIAGLSPQPDHVLIDGNRVPAGLAMPATAIVKGDATSVSIAAASIVAKVERDRIMRDLAEACPGYGWERNAGYATAAHLAALRKFGPTPHHRVGFAPVRAVAKGAG